MAAYYCTHGMDCQHTETDSIESICAIRASEASYGRSSVTSVLFSITVLLFARNSRVVPGTHVGVCLMHGTTMVTGGVDL